MVDILLVEDQEELSKLMSKFLLKDGYTVYRAMNGEEAQQFLSSQKARLVLLDLMLPGLDGFALCSYIRKKGDIPIIIISARVDKEAKMSGFQLGADDYIEKPVDIDILRAKLAALFKRFYEVQESTAVIRSGDLVIDQDKMKVTCKEKELNLTIKEYDLLLLLVENKGKTLNKEYLFQEIWGADSFSENQTLTVHIKMLRDKIEDDSRNPKRIQTVWGVGYRYEEI
jgi:Response regulators consisting of a CheY-like receiver domain and a winged-helix DNA-binding domain